MEDIHMTGRSKNYPVISDLMREAAETDRAAAMAFYCLEYAGSIYGRVYGYMTAADQRILFGRKIGKGLIIVDGSDETVGHSVSMCFGTMRDTVWTAPWRDLLHNANARGVL
jgi:hypothetical protein